MAGCTSSITSVTTTPPLIISAWPPLTSSNTPTPLPPDLRPVQVVSVEDTYKPGETVNPGGPEIEITLKNVSTEPVINLAATLDLHRPTAGPFHYYFTAYGPILPGKTASDKQRLIGGFGGVPYTLTINGTLESGGTFTYSLEYNGN
jgi:hypothetical protein